MAYINYFLLVAQNWTLFFSLLKCHLEEMVRNTRAIVSFRILSLNPSPFASISKFPVIYTPTEADAIASYSHLFRRSEGLFLSLPLQDSMEEDFLNAVGDRKLGLVSSDFPNCHIFDLIFPNHHIDRRIGW